MIEFLDPRAESAVPISPYDLAVSGEDGPLDIGLLANGFPDSVPFLEHVAKALSRELPDCRFHRFDKGDASIVVPPEMLEEIVGRCQAVVAAYGH